MISKERLIGVLEEDARELLLLCSTMGGKLRVGPDVLVVCEAVEIPLWFEKGKTELLLFDFPVTSEAEAESMGGCTPCVEFYFEGITTNGIQAMLHHSRVYCDYFSMQCESVRQFWDALLAKTKKEYTKRTLLFEREKEKTPLRQVYYLGPAATLWLSKDGHHFYNTPEERDKLGIPAL